MKAMDCANEAHYKSLLQALKYVLTTSQLGIEYDSGSMVNFYGKWKIVAYCDSNFGGDKNSRNIVSGFCIYVESYLVSWRSQYQKSVSLSSTEAEYYAVSKVCTEIIFINNLLQFLRMKIEFPITFWCDNVGVIFLSYNAKNSNKKHIDIQAH